ncbi:MAG TPA: adenylate/guanylate cyclase domain-containing protein [Candidatus Acidoferrum sp.]|nr:adenylate/guanylate cyclase domain-containing protein [Candidatus Acidoferrum sp.]
MRANTIVTKILELSHDSPELLRELETFRRSVTIMFTDITGSTAYFEKFGDLAGFAMVHRCNDLLQRVAEDHHGRVLKNLGDAIMAMFESCTEGVDAAIDMQRRLSSANLQPSEEERVRIRIGLHYGSGIVKSNDVFGDVVNTASRVETVAGPEQIVISDCLHRELPKSMFDIVLLGRFRLKGKSEERELFEVRWNKKLTTTLNRTHVPAISSAGLLAQPLKLQHVNRVGTVDAEHPLTPEGLTIGRSEANINFPDDSGMESVHAQVLATGGQVWVRDCNGAGNLYVRLVATYALENDNVIIMGSQQLQFQKDADILAAAASLGKTLPDITRLLNEPAAKFVHLNRDNSGNVDVYPLSLEEVRFGRVSGLYTFPDDQLMSRAHARVFRRGEDFFLEDMGSRNGTFVRVRGKTPIPIGAGILVSHQTFRIVP